MLNNGGDNNIFKIVFDKLKVNTGNFFSPTLIITHKEKANHSGWSLKNNSPVIVTYIALSIIAFWLKNTSFGQNINPWLSLPKELSSIGTIESIKLLTYVFGYGDWNSLLQNIIFLLLLGPFVEKQYSSKLILVMIIATTMLVGILQVLFYGGSHAEREIGGACIVYMLIMVASATNVKSNEIPITLVLLIVFLIGGQSITGNRQYISLPPVVGGILGFIYAIVMPRVFPNIRIVSLPNNSNMNQTGLSVDNEA